MLASPSSAFLFVHRNRTYYLPFLISPQFLPTWLQLYYVTWLCFELFGHLLTLISLILFVSVMWKAKAFHINMIILNTYAILLLGGINMITRVALIQIELGIVQAEAISDLIVPLHLIKNCAWLAIYHYVIYATAERYAALRFAADYESSRRIWVSGLLIVINTAVTIPIAFMLINDFINGAIYSAVVCAVSLLSCWVFARIKKLSLRKQRELVSFANINQYSVSHRWQVKENIRLSKDIRFYIFGCAMQVVFYLAMFFVPPLLFGINIYFFFNGLPSIRKSGTDPRWRQFLEFSKASFQLICSYGFAIAYVFCTISIGRHVEYIRSRLGLRVNARIIPLFEAKQSPEEYFSNLNGWWTHG